MSILGYKQMNGFKIYKSWEDLLGYSIDMSGGKRPVFCPFCHDQRTKAVNKKKKEMTIIPTVGKYKCNHCHENGYINPAVFTKVEYKRPERMAQSQTHKQVWVNWYKDRGIGQAILEKYEVVFSEKYMRNIETGDFENMSARSFPYIAKGQLISYKIRSQNKSMTRTAESGLIYGGINHIPKGAKYICIVEGEEDLLAVAQTIEGKNEYGVITVPNGASERNNNLGYHDISWQLVVEMLDENYQVILCTDDDPAGRSLSVELARRVGSEVCKQVHWGESNDPNKFLLEHGADALFTKIQKATPVPIAEITALDDVWEELEDAYENGRKPYCRLMWGEFDDLLTLKPGAQSTLICAPPQTAKSELAFNIAFRLAVLHGWKFGILSPETGQPSEVFEALFEIGSGKHFAKNLKYKYEPRMTEGEKQELKDFIRDHFFVIAPDNMENYSINSVSEMLEVMVKRNGITAYIIDPLNDIPDFFQENLAQGLIAELHKLKTFYRKHNLHQFLVAHPTNVDPLKMMATNQVFGGSVIPAKMDNMIFAQRHYDTAQLAIGVGDSMTVAIRKVKARHAGRRGEIKFEYHLASRRLKIESADEFDTYWSLLELKNAIMQEHDEEDDIPF